MPRNEYPALSGVNWTTDFNSLIAGPGMVIDWAQIPDSSRVGTQTVRVSAPAAVGATSVSVDALPVELMAGRLLDFGGAKQARLTANAPVGATTISVAALATALVAGDKATLPGSGPKFVPSGTVMVRLANGKRVPRATRPGAETAESILLSNAENGGDGLEGNAGYTGYGHIYGGAIRENLLPEATGSPAVLPAAYKTELRDAGRTFYFDQYSDSREASAVPLT